MTPKRFKKFLKYISNKNTTSIKERKIINIYRNTLGDDLPIKNSKQV